MRRTLKRRLAIAVAGLAVASGGAIAAVSATGQGATGKPRSAHRAALRRAAGAHGVLAAAVRYLGIPASQLRSDLRSGKTLSQIADATSGRSEAGLIQALVAARQMKLARASANETQRVSAMVNRPLTGIAGRPARTHGTTAAAVGYLGLPAATVRAELRSGKTLAQIADATPGKSESGLLDAIVAAESKRLEAAVRAGRLTEAQDSARLAKITKHAHTAVNRVHTSAKHSPKKSG